MTDTDMYRVVLECIRRENTPTSRFLLNVRLEHFGVYADDGQRDEKAVDRALQLLLDRHRIDGGDFVTVTDGERETAYTFVHLPRVKRRHRRSATSRTAGEEES